MGTNVSAAREKSFMVLGGPGIFGPLGGLILGRIYHRRRARQTLGLGAVPGIFMGEDWPIIFSSLEGCATIRSPRDEALRNQAFIRLQGKV